MPRTANQNYEAHPKQQFTHITIEQLQKLQAINLSGFQTRVWMALKLYAWNNKTCFPSLDSIADRIGLHTKSRRQQVSNALKALQGYGLIERNHHRQKPDRFVLKQLHSCSSNDESSCKPNDEQKQTQEQTNSQTPFNPPTDAGGKPTKKQRVRASRRRKRLRKQDLRNMQEVKEEQAAVKTRHEQAIADYKQAIEDAPKVLDALLDLHESKDTPKTPEEATRAFFIAATLKHCNWIDERLERPPHIQMCSQLHDEFTQDIMWKLRMSLRKLWEFVLRDEQLQKQMTS